MSQLTPHFTSDELACRCGCGQMRFSTLALERLEELRRACGFPFIVSSGYRCPAHDAAVYRERDPDFDALERFGPHTIFADDNVTVDLLVSGILAYNINQEATRRGWSGLGFNQRGSHERRYIHLDRLGQVPARPRPAIWTY